MLVEFKVSNYLSISEEQTLSMVANNADKTLLNHIKEFDKYKIKVLRTAGIFGPNASGKTNMLKAIDFMKKLVLYSSRNLPNAPTGVIPFKFLKGKDNRLLKFETTFILDDGVLYSYGFELSEKEIYNEWLHYYPKNQKRNLFQRSKTDGYKFGSDMKGRNKSIADMTKENSLFLSVAATMNEEKAKNIYAFFNNISPVLNQIDLLSSIIFMNNIVEYYKNKGKDKLISFLQKADLGITDLEIKTKNISKGVEVLTKILQDKGIEIKSSNKELDMDNLVGDEINFTHEYDGISGKLTINEESSGTQKLFYLLPFFIENKGIILIDELELSMHPHLINLLLDFYYDIYPDSQLIFTSHNSDLLDTEKFRRDEIWFTEKGKNGGTALFSLDDIKPKPRLEDDIKMRYLYGQYGAVPNI